ncbi:uncharacterized protein MYCGRDRAFT_75467 [Zymoseptoria tritici IPO323]|uniref:Uncharacterized protein n=1 Tax=Zymoseptoria tritici (strain CBS 115943 / IPO323) TaxID=336722 RepID=F9XJX0_ZYMTI|nr:uncharacterized protein MYCGRDRAFT_75467 [Zymoseptoria tritici IPO323]EGP84722.1 hypothetical protein MYCGRDRAFT_75467 [Zymoseptoria tritici IPO323]
MTSLVKRQTNDFLPRHGRTQDSGTRSIMNRLYWLGRIAVATCCTLALVLLVVWHREYIPAVWHDDPDPAEPTIAREPFHKPLPHIRRIACKGPRGLRLDDRDSRDLQRPLKALPGALNVTIFPRPTIGSYEELGLEKSWMSFAQRYGPYGYGEQETSYDFPRVNWNKVDWGALQTECLQDNERMFGASNQSIGENRFRLRNETTAPILPPTSRTGRHAIVMRTWSTYVYKDEDYWNLRSIINEASLATGGKYSVILLVDVKCKGCETIHSDPSKYQRVLEESVPKEFRNIAVLFHPKLQESWYDKIGEYKPFWQIMQPLQLLAHFYNDFDHYWQFEMDTRFTGHVGDMLEAFDRFGAAQPYKQALERASFAYVPKIHGTYEKFTKAIDEASKGSSSVWGPVKVKDVTPIGPTPLMQDPRNGSLEWRVGEEADLLVLGPITDVRTSHWPFGYWRTGDLKDYDNLPRYLTTPAQARASWELLEGIHRAQHDHGIAVASESTLPSFAVWLGLKIVSLPIPKFQFPERDILELSSVMNGEGYGDGIARGIDLPFFVRPLTWSWWSSLCDPVFERWMGLQPEHFKGDGGEHTHPEYVEVPNELPWFMAEVNGTVYMPGVSGLFFCVCLIDVGVGRY